MPRLIIGCNNKVKFFNPESGSSEGEISLPGRTVFRLQQVDDNQFACLKNDRSIAVCSLSDSEIVSNFKCHTSTSRGLHFERKSKILFTGTDRNEVEMYELPEGVCRVSLRGHSEAVSAIDSIPSLYGLTFTASADTTIRCWNWDMKKHLRAVLGHKLGVTCLCHWNGRRMLFSGSYDTRVLFWDGSNFRSEIGEMRMGSPVCSICSKGDSPEILVGCLSGQVTSIDVRNPEIPLWSVPNALPEGNMWSLRSVPDIFGGSVDTFVGTCTGLTSSHLRCWTGPFSQSTQPKMSWEYSCGLSVSGSSTAVGSELMLTDILTFCDDLSFSESSMREFGKYMEEEKQQQKETENDKIGSSEEEEGEGSNDDGDGDIHDRERERGVFEDESESDGDEEEEMGRDVRDGEGEGDTLRGRRGSRGRRRRGRRGRGRRGRGRGRGRRSRGGRGSPRRRGRGGGKRRSPRRRGRKGGRGGGRREGSEGEDGSGGRTGGPRGRGHQGGGDLENDEQQQGKKGGTRERRQRRRRRNLLRSASTSFGPSSSSFSYDRSALSDGDSPRSSDSEDEDSSNKGKRTKKGKRGAWSPKESWKLPYGPNRGVDRPPSILDADLEEVKHPKKRSRTFDAETLARLRGRTQDGASDGEGSQSRYYTPQQQRSRRRNGRQRRNSIAGSDSSRARLLASRMSRAPRFREKRDDYDGIGPGHYRIAQDRRDGVSISRAQRFRRKAEPSPGPGFARNARPSSMSPRGSPRFVRNSHVGSRYRKIPDGTELGPGSYDWRLDPGTFVVIGREKRFRDRGNEGPGYHDAMSSFKSVAAGGPSVRFPSSKRFE